MGKDIQLCLMEEDDREQFILDNQEAFNYGALEELGCRNNHFEEDGQIISRQRPSNRPLMTERLIELFLKRKKLAVL